MSRRRLEAQIYIQLQSNLDFIRLNIFRSMNVCLALVFSVFRKCLKYASILMTVLWYLCVKNQATSCKKCTSIVGQSQGEIINLKLTFMNSYIVKKLWKQATRMQLTVYRLIYWIVRRVYTPHNPHSSVSTHPRHQPAATWVNTTRYCKYSHVLLMMGENIARNM
jgi:hypothetical protein